MSTPPTSTPLRDVLITAGATRNPIDSMRFISAHSSGTTGANLASGLLNQGANVHLMASPEAAQRVSPNASLEKFESTRDLLARMENWIQTHPNALVIHAAAVGDYEASPQSGKIPSGQPVSRSNTAPPKTDKSLLGCQLFPGFAKPLLKHPQNLAEITLGQLQRSQSDLV